MVKFFKEKLVSIFISVIHANIYLGSTNNVMNFYNPLIINPSHNLGSAPHRKDPDENIFKPQSSKKLSFFF